MENSGLSYLLRVCGAVAHRPYLYGTPSEAVCSFFASVRLIEAIVDIDDCRFSRSVWARCQVRTDQSEEPGRLPRVDCLELRNIILGIVGELGARPVLSARDDSIVRLESAASDLLRRALEDSQSSFSLRVTESICRTYCAAMAYAHGGDDCVRWLIEHWSRVAGAPTGTVATITYGEECRPAANDSAYAAVREALAGELAALTAHVGRPD